MIFPFKKGEEDEFQGISKSQMKLVTYAEIL